MQSTDNLLTTAISEIRENKGLPTRYKANLTFLSVMYIVGGEFVGLLGISTGGPLDIEGHSF